MDLNYTFQLYISSNNKIMKKIDYIIKIITK